MLPNMVSLANRILSSVVPGKAAQGRFLRRHSAVTPEQIEGECWPLGSDGCLATQEKLWVLETLAGGTAAKLPKSGCQSSSLATWYCQPQCPAEPGTGGAVATEDPGPGGSHARWIHLPSEYIGIRKPSSGFPAFHISVPLSTDTASLWASKEHIFKGPDPFKRAGKESQLGA